MIRELHIAKSFKTDIKKLNKKEKNDTKEVVLKLQKDEPLEEKNIMTTRFTVTMKVSANAMFTRIFCWSTKKLMTATSTFFRYFV